LDCAGGDDNLLGRRVQPCDNPSSLTADQVYALTAHLLHQGLRDLGYVEGQTILLDYRYGEGRTDRPGLGVPQPRFTGDPQPSHGVQATANSLCYAAAIGGA
jgi:hypothetical protein